MTEYTRLFERARARFAYPELRLEGMYRRRDRKRRNEKVGAILLALVITMGSVAAVLAALGSSSRPKPADQTITPSNVGQLQVQWTGDMGADAPPPVVTDGVVEDATMDGHVIAFPDGCANDGSACSPLWTAKIDWLPGVIDRSDRTITWWPIAHGVPGEAFAYAAFTAAAGTVYAVSKSGTVYAFDVHCRADGGLCDPIWTAHVPSPVGRLPVVSDGLVLVQGAGGTFAFQVGCGSGGASCSAAWHIPQAPWIRVQDGILYSTNPNDGFAYAVDAHTGRVMWRSAKVGCCSNDSTPVRYGDTVYVNFGFTLEAFPADCRGICDPTWKATIPDRFSSGPVVIGNTVAITVAPDASTAGV